MRGPPSWRCRCSGSSTTPRTSGSTRRAGTRRSPPSRRCARSGSRSSRASESSAARASSRCIRRSPGGRDGSGCSRRRSRSRSPPTTCGSRRRPRSRERPEMSLQLPHYPHVRVSGDAFERGRAYGAQARDRVHTSVEGYQAAFFHYAGWEWGRVRQEAARFEEPIAELYPSAAEEMYGIASGAGLDFEDVLALNVRTEGMFSAKARQAARERGRTAPAECSAFAILPEASAEHHTLVGQNWDWLLHCFDTVVVLEVEQPDAPDFVTVVEAGLLAKAGMNSSGIGLTTNALVTERDLGKPGIPFHVLVRALYDAETLTDALQTLQAGVRSSSANYLIAHRDGTAMSVEAAPGDFSD